MSQESLSFVQRLVFAYVCFFRVLANGVFAARVKALSENDALALPESEESPRPGLELELAEETAKGVSAPPVISAPTPDPAPALQLLALLQREGRLVDFLQQDIQGFDDAEVGTAARVVHEGCRKVLTDRATLEPVQSENEGDEVTIESGYDVSALKLTGNVKGEAPYRGTLRHRGWRATEFSLPELVGEVDSSVLAVAEVEL